MKIFLIFPVHLFKDIQSLKNHKIYIIEDPIYFTDYKYHKLKLAYHRATMKTYYDYLKKNKLNPTYLNFKDAHTFYESISKEKEVYTYQVFDNQLNKKLKKYIKNLIILDSLNFLVNQSYLDENKDKFYKNGKYNHMGFYKMQRIYYHILMNKDGTPKGGKWSFDTENREKIPVSQKIPEIEKLIYKNNKYVKEAINYINKHFPKNYGSLENFIYPIHHEDSLKWLKHFCKVKFKLFGKYEDAETMRDPFLFHSVLTPMMNIGLLTDKEVLEEIKKYENKVPLNSY